MKIPEWSITVEIATVKNHIHNVDIFEDINMGPNIGGIKFNTKCSWIKGILLIFGFHCAYFWFPYLQDEHRSQWPRLGHYIRDEFCGCSCKTALCGANDEICRNQGQRICVQPPNPSLVWWSLEQLSCQNCRMMKNRTRNLHWWRWSI